MYSQAVVKAALHDVANSETRDTCARALSKDLLLAACEPFHPTGCVCQWVRDEPGYKADDSDTNASSPDDPLNNPALRDDNELPSLAPPVPINVRPPVGGHGPPPLRPPRPRPRPPIQPPPVGCRAPPPPPCQAPPRRPPQPTKPRGAQVISGELLTRAAIEIHSRLHRYILGVGLPAAISTSEDLQRALVRALFSPTRLVLRLHVFIHRHLSLHSNIPTGM